MVKFSAWTARARRFRALFNAANFVDHFFKTIFAEKFVRFLLETLARRIIFVTAHDFAKL